MQSSIPSKSRLNSSFQTIALPRAGAAMKYRKLRVTWSAVCGIICLLLIALWVRSYWWFDHLQFPITGVHYVGC